MILGIARVSSQFMVSFQAKITNFYRVLMIYLDKNCHFSPKFERKSTSTMLKPKTK